MAVIDIHKITCLNGHTFEDTRDCLACPTCAQKVSFGWKNEIIERRIETDKNAVLNRFIEWCDNNNFHIDVYDGCVEPGYTDQLTIAANWNDKGARLYDWLERYFDDINLEWSDEWSRCDDCYKALRISPDCYHWERYALLLNDCELVCLDCIKDNLEDVIEQYTNQTDRALPSELISEAKNIGFDCLEDCEIFETGFHHGQDDNPDKVLSAIYHKVGAEWFTSQFDFIFIINEVSQFYVKWSMLVRRKEIETN